MAGENGPIFLGSRRITGATGVCQICMNKSELQYMEGDDRAMCEECTKVMVAGRKSKEQVASGPARPAVHLVEVPSSDEKLVYLSVIRQGMTESIADEVINELVGKKVFHFDFGKIIENDRWFSLMDLRRLALKVNPEFERPSKSVELRTNGTDAPVRVTQKPMNKRRNKS